MTTIEAGLRGLLIADPTIASFVGARVSPAPAPQNQAFPFITFQRITGLRDQTLDGPSGMALPMFQIDVWCDGREQLQGGNSYMASRAIATAVRLALDNYSGQIGDYAGKIMLLDERDLTEDTPPATRVSMDFRIRHEEETLL